MNYIELKIELIDIDPWGEIFTTYLAENGFESFVQEKEYLKCYISKADFSKENIDFLNDYKEHFKNSEIKEIQDKNWNAEWEKNFDPVFVGDDLAILAPFHKSIKKVGNTILIQPQMSFGTGHHQTTWLASKRLLSLNLKDKTVLDMGTGTGVLAILSEKLGAKSVFAPDIDIWSFNNAKENLTLNNCSKIEVELGGKETILNKKFDVLIANINKNILIDQFESLSNSSNSKSTLLISGFFSTDVDDLKLEAEKFGFIFEEVYSKDEWALVEFIKK